jgi:hypothetical protein
MEDNGGGLALYISYGQAANYGHVHSESGSLSLSGKHCTNQERCAQRQISDNSFPVNGIEYEHQYCVCNHIESWI